MDSIPFVDPSKERVFISLGMPIYNELIKGHLHATLNDAIAVGFDDIVILDDGSDDGTWEVLQEYSAKYPVIRAYKNEINSVFNKGANRWKFVVDRMAEKNPDWIVVRAGDQVYSHKASVIGGDLFRKKLTEFYHKGIELVKIPLAHLWRSETWFRADNVWGNDIRIHSKTPIWRFHKDYHFKGRTTTGAHKGWHHPTSWGFGDKRKKKFANINEGQSCMSWPIVVLHLGHTTHYNKELKFRWSMKAATENFKEGAPCSMPPPFKMPKVSSWLQFDGYKGFHEFKMLLKKAPQLWYSDETNIQLEKKPTPESFYNVIFEFNKPRAQEYLNLFNRTFGKVVPNKKVIQKNPSTETPIYEGELT